MSSPPPDEELLQSISEGRQEALQQFIGRYASRLGIFVMRIAGDSGATPADVEEVVADCFVKVWLSVTNPAKGSTIRYDAHKAPVEGWLMHIARYEALSLRRRKLRERSPLSDQALLHLADTIPAAGEVALDDLMAQQRAVVVQQALMRLPPDDAAILRLRYAEDRSPKEIAATLGLTPNAARVRLSRALTRLRAELG